MMLPTLRDVTSAQQHTGYGAAMPHIASIEDFPVPAMLQETSDDAESFVKAIHAGNLIRTCYGPIAMPNNRRSPRVVTPKNARDRANSDRERLPEAPRVATSRRRLSHGGFEGNRNRPADREGVLQDKREACAGAGRRHEI
jgi:hypothetical protein